MVNSNTYKQYFNIWLLLMFLTVVTVGVAQFDFGSLNIPIAMLIASIKAGVVALHFMHLKYDKLFGKIKRKSKKRYFENLIAKYLSLIHISEPTRRTPIS